MTIIVFMKPPEEALCLTELEQASVALHPLRLETLRLLRSPGSASQVAERLGLPRQRVNYHVRELHRVGLLRRAGRRNRRNLTEQLYQATARSYLLAPDVLGPVGADPEHVEDRLGATYLLALSGRLQKELAAQSRRASREGKRLATLSIDADLRFESARQREAFAVALRDAVARVVAEHASPDSRDDGRPGAGRPYRLVLGCYPRPVDEPASTQEDGGAPR